MGKTDNKSSDTKRTSGSADDSSTEATSTKRKRGRPRKDREPAETGATGQETTADVPRLVLVDVPEEAEEDPKPQQPKKPSAKKSSSKKSTSKKSDVIFLEKNQVAVLIKTSFDIVGAREGFEIWKLSEKEAQQLAEPLATILNKNDYIGKLANDYGDFIALFIAAATIILPRLFMQLQTNKAKKKEKIKPYVTTNQPNKTQATASTNRTARDEGRKAGNSGGQPPREPSAASQTFSQQLHSIIPAIQ